VRSEESSHGGERLRRGGDREAEPAARSRCTLHSNLAPVGLDDPAHNREPQAGPMPATWVMLLPVAVEHAEVDLSPKG
jgi:hypothetical protein